MEQPRLFPAFRRAPAAIGRGVLWLWRHIWRWLAGLFVLLLLVHTIANIVTGRRLEHELRKLKAAGAPLTLTEAAPPPVPDDENAAVLYEKAFNMLPRGKDAELIAGFMTAKAPQLQQPPFEWSPRAVERIVARSAPVFRLLKEAAARPDCRFPVNWGAGAEALLPHLAKLREVMRLLGAKALLEARHGDASKAFDDIILMLRTSDQLAGEPALVSQLVRIACQNIAVYTLNQVMDASPPSEADARRMYEALRSIDEFGPFTHGLEGERAFGIWMFDLLRRNPRQFAVDQGLRTEPFWARAMARPLLFLWAPLLNLDEVWYLRLATRQVELSRRPSAQARGGYDALEKQIEHGLPRYAIVTRLFFTVFSRAMEVRDKALAQIGVAQDAMAIRAFQAASGRDPASLAELRKRINWPLARDPFGGKDFIYRRQGKGYLLYSIGPNMKDEGGANLQSMPASPRQREKRPDDIAWRMSR